jgi:hypothetical protein
LNTAGCWITGDSRLDPGKKMDGFLLESYGKMAFGWNLKRRWLPTGIGREDGFRLEPDVGTGT